MRRLVLEKFGQDIEKLDSQVLSKIAKGEEYKYFGGLKGQIFKEWIEKNIAGVEKISSITFELAAAKGRNEVKPDFVQGGIIIEAKAYHGGEGTDKLDQAKNYLLILENKIPGIVKKGEKVELPKIFTKVKYMFSNNKTRDKWEKHLKPILKGYLELWSPRDLKS